MINHFLTIIELKIITHKIFFSLKNKIQDLIDNITIKVEGVNDNVNPLDVATKLVDYKLTK